MREPTPRTAGPAARSLRDRRDRILLRRYARTKDPELRAELVERFLPLARSLASRYASGVELMEDLVQVASEGLIRAIDGYDPSRRNGFSSYASPMILGAIRHHLRDNTDSIHLSRGLQERVQKVTAAGERCRARSGRPPSVEELAEATEMEAVEVLEALEAKSRRRPLSIDRPAAASAEEEGAPVAETIGRPDPGYERVEASLASRSAGLEAIERRVIALRYGRHLNQREIGSKIGVSQMQVSRLLRRAHVKLLASLQAGAPMHGTPRTARQEG